MKKFFVLSYYLTLLSSFATRAAAAVDPMFPAGDDRSDEPTNNAGSHTPLHLDKATEEQVEKIVETALKDIRNVLTTSSLRPSKYQEQSLLLSASNKISKNPRPKNQENDGDDVFDDHDYVLVPKDYVDEPLRSRYADRHIKAVNRIANDPDCMSRELDAKDPNFDLDEAVRIMDKCRLLVIRNVLDPDFVLRRYKPLVRNYLHQFQTRALDPEFRAMYDAHFPSKRYEIMLPKLLAHREMVANPLILEFLRHPKMLDEEFFLHSLGTVAVEPGANHQEWHEEDDYLFDSQHSMNHHGIGGHDLPPYSINMFTPLLNLTYDHGPTEFCVGTSYTSGLLDGDWNVHDPTLLDDPTSPFHRLWDFHRDLYHTLEDADGTQYVSDKSCPTPHWRSVLLNVGDVVLFDYQIIHRAGHNLSNETRVQVYLAYVRKWFRDLNYERNRHLKYQSASSGLLSKTRFAEDVPDEAVLQFAAKIVGADEEQDAANHPKDDDPTDSSSTTGACDAIPPTLEALRNILPQPDDPFAYDLFNDFIVWNKDLDNANVFVQVDDESPQPLVGPGRRQFIEAKVGSLFSILDGSTGGTILKTWKIPVEFVHLYLTQAMMGQTSTTTTTSTTTAATAPAIEKEPELETPTTATA